MIRLVEDTIDNNDIDNLVSWLQTYPRLTKGHLTVEFEQKKAKNTFDWEPKHSLEQIVQIMVKTDLERLGK